VIVLGIILVVVFGWLIAIPILFDLGVVLIVVGVILELFGALGHPVLGRRHYY
jgi:hypothetical protein